MFITQSSKSVYMWAQTHSRQIPSSCCLALSLSPSPQKHVLMCVLKCNVCTHAHIYTQRPGFFRTSSAQEKILP